MRTKFITDTSHFSQIASALVVKTGAGSVKNVHHVVAEDYVLNAEWNCPARHSPIVERLLLGPKGSSFFPRVAFGNPMKS